MCDLSYIIRYHYSLMRLPTWIFLLKQFQTKIQDFMSITRRVNQRILWSIITEHPNNKLYSESTLYQCIHSCPAWATCHSHLYSYNDASPYGSYILSLQHCHTACTIPYRPTWRTLKSYVTSTRAMATFAIAVRRTKRASIKWQKMKENNS